MQELNRIDTDAFAAENAQVMRDIANLNNSHKRTDPAELAAINALAAQLGHDYGIPAPAAALIATRIVKLEMAVAQLERGQQPAHLQGVERRG